ncbi:MAG: DUF4406 domain-containing protein [Erysipelotrichaceae bacterium]|jgi:hypothetical protein
MEDNKEILEYKELLDMFDKADEYYPLVYVCSPYRGNVEENVINARKYSRFTFDNKNIPLTPHLLYPQFLNDDDIFERNIAIHKINYVLIGLCKEMWVFGDAITDGMQREILIAKKRKMRIRYFSQDLKEES